MSKTTNTFFSKKNNWSEVKDRLLGSYLVPYFAKVLKTGKPLLYVDCFSGKGKFDDGTDGSPLIALKIRETALGQTSASNPKIETYFIDLRYTNALTTNLASHNKNNGQVNIVAGKYEEKIKEILKDKQNYNVFLYIDPYGIKALDTALFDEFKKLGFNSFEMLINFNSFGFFREACRVMGALKQDDDFFKDLDDEIVEYDATIVDKTKQSEDLLISIAGGDYWKAIVTEYSQGKIDGYKAEQKLTDAYRKMLRAKYAFVLDMPIRLKAGQRPKYRMIHACNHQDGCYLMAQNMQSRKDELFLHVQQGGQVTFFDIMGQIQTAENEFITDSEIDTKVFEECKKLTSAGLKKFIADFYNENGILCDFKQLQAALKRLETNGDILIVREPALTKTGKKTEFWEESKDHKVIITTIKRYAL